MAMIHILPESVEMYKTFIESKEHIKVNMSPDLETHEDVIVEKDVGGLDDHEEGEEEHHEEEEEPIKCYQNCGGVP